MSASSDVLLERMDRLATAIEHQALAIDRLVEIHAALLEQMLDDEEAEPVEQHSTLSGR